MADEDEVDVVGEFEYQPQNESDRALPNPPLMHCDKEQMAKEEATNLMAQYASSLDDQSKITIQNMLQEEKLHGLTKDSAFNVELSPNKTPWNDEEKNIFIKGMEIHGRKWSKISRMIGTRNVLQVRNYARQYLKKQENNTSEQMKITCLANTEGRIKSDVDESNLNFCPEASEVVRIQKEGLEDHEDIEVECDFSDEDYTDTTEDKHKKIDQFHTPLKTIETKNMVNSYEVPNNNIIVVTNEYTSQTTDAILENFIDNENISKDKAEIQDHSLLEGKEGNQTEAKVPSPPISELEDKVIIEKEEDKNSYVKSERISEIHSDLHNDLNSLEANMFHFISPQCEVKMIHESISEEEKQIHHDFFEGRPPKTPARYLKIRNYILDAWEKTKPNYLNKTSVRSGLRNCGDVNCIGRIHSYLEVIGAINFGCDQACYNRQNSISFITCNKQKRKVDVSHQQVTQKDNKRLRKRKLLDEYDLEKGGYTIQHKSSGDVLLPGGGMSKGQAPMRKPRNPFKLIPYADFHKGFEAPYQINLFLEAVVTMDLHAHCSRTEIIGLLGGHFDARKGVLYVKMAEPCQSLSTSMQCEMDPVSQTVASEFIQKRSLNVVGWYHSHPTFPPNPSLRDLETQAKYQEWFNQRHHPFLAVIINPYNVDVASKFRCMIVGQDSVMNVYKKPYRLQANFTSQSFVADQCLQQAKKALHSLTFDNGNIISLKSIYVPQPKYTYLEKMMKSIEHHVRQSGASSLTFDKFLDQLRNLILRVFEDLQMPMK